jgi:hypothetical protein
MSAICTMHGRKLSEHLCLFCCLCFKDLTVEQCHTLPDGTKEDVCNECAEKEQTETARRVGVR